MVYFRPTATFLAVSELWIQLQGCFCTVTGDWQVVVIVTSAVGSSAGSVSNMHNIYNIEYHSPIAHGMPLSVSLRIPRLPSGGSD